MFCLHLAPKSTGVYWFNWTLACHQQKQVGINSSSVFLSYVLAILAFKALPASFNRLREQQSISRRASRSSVDSPVLIKMSLVLLGWVFHGIPVPRIINKLSQWILILLPILPGVGDGAHPHPLGQNWSPSPLPLPSQRSSISTRTNAVWFCQEMSITWH